MIYFFKLKIKQLAGSKFLSNVWGEPMAFLKEPAVYWAGFLWWVHLMFSEPRRFSVETGFFACFEHLPVVRWGEARWGLNIPAGSLDCQFFVQNGGNHPTLVITKEVHISLIHHWKKGTYPCMMMRGLPGHVHYFLITNSISLCVCVCVIDHEIHGDW